MPTTEARGQVDSAEGAERPDSSEGSEREEQATAPGRTAAQIFTTALSLLLIALLAGAILYEGYGDRGNNPARIEVEVRADEAEQRGEHWYVPILVRNLGDDTIEELVIGIDVSRGAEIVLETDTTIAQLGESAEASATLVLDEDPTTLTIEALPETFQVAEE